MTKRFLKSWRSIASAVVLIVAANACGSGTISGGGDKVVAGLRFTTQPTASGAAGATFSLAVELLDASGAKISNADDVVTLTVNGGADLLGNLSQAAVGGVATFSGLSVTRAGTGYSISAAANGHNASSSSFTVTPGAATAGQSGATFNPSTITTGATIAVVFTFKDSFGNPIPNKTVTLSTNLAGVTFTPSTGSTSATGTFSTNMVATGAGSATVSASVDGVSINLPTAVTITAPVTFTITTSSNPANGGTTSGGGTKTQGAAVTVVATPAATFTFTNWTEGATVVSTSASFAFTATANRTLVANFAASNSGDCTPSALTFPGTANFALPTAGACVINGSPASVHRFTATGTGGVTLTGSATYSHLVEVATDPVGTGQVTFIGTGAVGAEWLLPAGSYLFRLFGAPGSTGPFTITGTATSGNSNNSSGGCTAGVSLRVIVVGGTYSGQSLGAGDCTFSFDNSFFDSYFVRSTKGCTITMTPSGFNAYMAIDDALTGSQVVPDINNSSATNASGAESVTLPSCSSANGANPIQIIANSFSGGETGTYTLAITFVGGTSLMSASSSFTMYSSPWLVPEILPGAKFGPAQKVRR